MCNFFSFTSDGKGNFKYFDWELRKKVISGEIRLNSPYIRLDDCTQINRYFGFISDDDYSRNNYEYNPFTKMFEVADINGANDFERAKEWVENIDFKTIAPQLIIKPIINPLSIDNVGKDIDINIIETLRTWDLFQDPQMCLFWDLLADSIGDSLRNFILSLLMDSLLSPIRDSLGDFIWKSLEDLIRDLIGAYAFSFVKDEYITFKDIHKVKALISLWESGYLPVFDGKTWRILAGNNAHIVFEISREKLHNI